MRGMPRINMGRIPGFSSRQAETPKPPVQKIEKPAVPETRPSEVKPNTMTTQVLEGKPDTPESRALARYTLVDDMVRLRDKTGNKARSASTDNQTAQAKSASADKQAAQAKSAPTDNQAVQARSAPTDSGAGGNGGAGGSGNGSGGGDNKGGSGGGSNGEFKRPTEEDVVMARTWKEMIKPHDEAVIKGERERQKYLKALKAVDPYQPGLKPKQQLEYTQKSAHIKREMADFERRQHNLEGGLKRDAEYAMAQQKDINAGIRNDDASKSDKTAISAADSSSVASPKGFENLDVTSYAEFEKRFLTLLSPGAEGKGAEGKGGVQATSGEATSGLADAYLKGKIMEAYTAWAIADMPGTQRRDDTKTALGYRGMGDASQMEMAKIGEMRATSLENQASNMMKEVTRQQQVATQEKMMKAMIVSNVMGNLSNVGGQAASMAGVIGSRAAGAAN